MTIGLLGLGNIGSGVYEHLTAHGDIKVKKILELLRHPGLEHLETSDFNEILNDPEIDTVVELIGGDEPAHTFTIQAMKAGKNVVSANKLMISRHMEELLTTARECNVQYRYDASVGGSIPYLYNLMRHRSADNIIALSGIVNGTTNLILDTMQNSTRSFDDVLAEAQRLGYAEANPSSDIDGFDAESKICISSSIAYGKYVNYQDIDTEGIRHITGEDIIQFKQQGFVCRLIVHSAKIDDEKISVYVEPTLVSPESTEAAVHTNNNTISITGEYFGLHHFYGQGAGKDPTAFAVEMGLRDIIDGIPEKLNPLPQGYAVVDNSAVIHRYYLRTNAEISIEAEKLGPCGDGIAYITAPMSVQVMHTLAKQLREEGFKVFFAGIRD